MIADDLGASHLPELLLMLVGIVSDTHPVDVPDDIIALAVDAWFPLTQGFVPFDRGPSLEALLAAWSRLEKRIIPFTNPPS